MTMLAHCHTWQNGLGVLEADLDPPLPIPVPSQTPPDSPHAATLAPKRTILAPVVSW
jgi:hypothetical protein